ncbi:MAG: DUF302 domain-containing protein [Thiohalocapsa sp.]|jgi:uncharacterized protein (DUF302 family)|uniref:DUF302 domain-containing protein n=1 Tax=Thiohalocapsa sp. TaxID=2497641 RepID=UPI0025DA8339|nr:DUF302 domain-containing protein [Thiohalocapsa sp.]MCG6942558.1 DUF302 domain-containing protein [Thiohalocapsa sp.]
MNKQSAATGGLRDAHPAAPAKGEPNPMRIKSLLLTVAFLASLLGAPCATFAAEGSSISDTVLKMPLADGVSMDDAVDSMKLRANSLNFKLVAHLPLYKELQAMGVESKRIEIFQFCDARIAKEMVTYNPDFSAYLPCRITLIEDADGKPWLVTLDLGKVLQNANLSPELQEKAEQVRDNIQSIMEAGANGDL